MKISNTLIVAMLFQIMGQLARIQGYEHAEFMANIAFFVFLIITIFEKKHDPRNSN